MDVFGGGPSSTKVIAVPLHTLYSEHEPPVSMDVVEPILTEKRSIVSDPPSAALVYKLFKYFAASLTDLLVPDYEVLYRQISDRCSSDEEFMKDLDAKRTNIETTMRTFVRRMILEMFTVDDKGSKIKQILAQLEELYILKEPPQSKIVRKSPSTTGGVGGIKEKVQQPERVAIRNGRSNFINADSIHRNIEKTHKESLLDEKDQFKEDCSGRKKRGRHSSATKANKPDKVDQIKGSHILSQKSVPPIVYDEVRDELYITNSSGTVGIQNMVDFYPVFLKVLAIVNDCVPRQSNHGVFLQCVNSAARRLTRKEWPMHDLVKSIMNMERMFPILKKRVPSEGGPYYCSYTGEKLVVGEEVWHLRILVNDGDRYKQWVINQNVPPCPSIAPEFTRSIHVYFIKTEVCSLCSLFYTKLDSHKMSPIEVSKNVRKIVKSPRVGGNTNTIKTTKSTGIPPDRLISVNTLWLMLNKLRMFIKQERIGSKIWKQGFHTTTSSYNEMLEMCMGEMREITEKETASVRLTALLFLSTFGRDFDGEVSIESIITDPNVAEYMFNTHAAVLDFIDIMFPFKVGSGGGGGGNQITRHQFNLNSFGIRNGEEDRIPTTITPVIADPDSVLLAELFTQSYNRNEYYVSIGRVSDYKSRKEMVENVEAFMIQHPFLFLSLFYTIFEEHVPQKRPMFMECNNILNRMNLFINTSMGVTS